MARIVFHPAQAHQVTEHARSLSHVLPETQSAQTPVAVAAVGGRRLGRLFGQMRSPWPTCLRSVAGLRAAFLGERPIPWEEGIGALYAAERALQTGAITLSDEVLAIGYVRGEPALYIDDAMHRTFQDPLASAAAVAVGLGADLRGRTDDEYLVLGRIERAVQHTLRYGPAVLLPLSYAQRIDVQRVAMAAIGGDAMIPLSEVFFAITALSQCRRVAAEAEVDVLADGRVRIDVSEDAFAGPFAAAQTSTLRAFRRSYFLALLERCDNNISEAARVADIDRSNFRRLCKRAGVFKGS